MSNIQIIKKIRLGNRKNTEGLQYNEVHIAETPILIGHKIQIILYKESTEEYASILKKHFLIYEENE